MIWPLVIFLALLVLFPRFRTLLFILFGLAYFGMMDFPVFDGITGQHHITYSCDHPEQLPDLQFLARVGKVWKDNKICNADLTGCQGCDDFGPAKNVKEIPSRATVK